MPSPFPGMDPYLEAPDHWPGVHTRLVATIGDVLVPQVRPRYFVDLERRVYILDEDDPAQRRIVPDLSLIRRRGPGPAAPQADAATAPQAPAVLLMVQEPVEVRESRLVIRTAGALELVTVIELLSHANKTRGSHGRDEYLAKRREVLLSPVHLIEIDLLRAGVPFPSIDPLPAGDYRVHVSRAARRPRGEVFTWTVRDAAPVIPVPLRPGDPDATLDLGQVLRLTYDRAGYDVLLDYARPPDPPLGPDDAAWAAGRTAGPSR